MFHQQIIDYPVTLVNAYMECMGMCAYVCVCMPLYMCVCVCGCGCVYYSNYDHYFKVFVLENL